MLALLQRQSAIMAYVHINGTTLPVGKRHHIRPSVMAWTPIIAPGEGAGSFQSVKRSNIEPASMSRDQGLGLWIVSLTDTPCQALG
jgi:hypothetical protein